MASKKSIIKDSPRIRELLKERFKELDLSAKAIVLDAKDRKMNFTNASLSKYMNHGNIASSLTEENIIWLCTRYGLPINLFVGKAVKEKGGIKFIVPDYDESECLKKLDLIFPTEKDGEEK